jgi:Flp pilus assembly protein TadG
MADTADGSMPPVIKGEGYEISSLDNSLLVFFGAHDNNFAFNLAHNANGGNKHIISVPYNTTALNLGQITSNMNNIQDITGAGAATPPTQVELIARFNSANQMPENVIWTGVEWMADTMDGSMPPMVRGEGLEISTINNMNWKPAVVQ